MITQETIVGVATDWLGVPFAHQGRSRLGVDCIGLVVCVLREVGIPIIDDTTYPAVGFGDRLQRALESQLTPSPLQPGSVVLFNVYGGPNHCGIFTGESVIHAYSISGKVVEHPWTTRWAMRYSSSWVIKCSWAC